MSATVAGIKAGVALAEELEAVRGQITELSAELRTVAALPLPLADAIARAKAMVSGAALPRLDLSTFMRDDAGPPRTDLSWAMQQDVNGILLALVGEQIGKAVEAQLKGAYASNPRTLSAQDRRRRISDLEAKLLNVEIEEERIVRAGEAAGVELPRRATARPEIVLAAELEE